MMSRPTTMTTTTMAAYVKILTATPKKHNLFHKPNQSKYRQFATLQRAGVTGCYQS